LQIQLQKENQDYFVVSYWLS